MRLTSLRLRRYGPFEDLTLALDPAPGRINLICAPNGAGKSVLRGAFCDLLFGIGGKSPMAFRFRNTASMHLAATALTSDGAHLAFGRRKGHGNTLTDEAGAASDTITLSPHLGTTDREALERLFALDTERLRAGGSRLMASGGLIADALLSAGGLGSAREIRRGLEAQADSLAPSRKSSQRPFYLAADAFVAARKAAHEALLKPDAWEKLAAEIAAADAALAAARAKAADAQAAMTRLQRLRRVRPALLALDAAEAWLQAHPDAPVLAASLRQRLDEAAANLRAAVEKLRTETLRRDGLHAELAAIPQHDALLAQAPAIDLLAEHAGAVGKALEDLPARQAELAQIEARIAHRLRSLGAPGAEAQSLIPARALATQTRALIRGHGEHEGACRAASHSRDELVRKIAAHRETPASDATDTGALSALIGEIRVQGDPALQSREAASRHAAAQAALSRALAETPFWTAGEHALRTLTLPAMPVVEAAHAALVKAEAALARHQEAEAAAGTRLAEAEARLRAIIGDRIVPDRDAVDAARTRRNTLWDLVARTAFGPAPGAGELAVLAGQPLALAYERAVAEADLLADRRADESDLIARAALAERQVEEAAESYGTALAVLTASREASANALAAWHGLLPAQLPAGCRLDDVRSFAAARLRVIERWEQAQSAAQVADALTAQHAAWTQRLRATLLQDTGDLPDLLGAAMRQVERATAAAQQEAAYRASLHQLEEQHRAAQSACHHTEAARVAWRADWARALAALGRPADEAPEVTEDILGVLADLDTDLALATGLGTRITAMQSDNAAFTAKLAAIAEAAGAAGDHAGAPMPADPATALIVLRQLRQAAGAARERDSKRTTLAAQWEQAGRQVTELTHAQALRQGDLDAALAAIGAVSTEQAELRLAHAAERAGHEAAREQAAGRLLQDGDGVEIAVLRHALSALSAEDVARELYTAEAAATAAQAEAEAQAARVALLRRDLAQREAETSYGDAIAAQNEAAAAAGRVLREATIARLAACMLGAAMDAVEKQATPVMLQRISAWFSRLTGGAYGGVGVEQTAEGAALILTEAAFPDERREVDELSEGTRDQLYLALRLAAIDGHEVQLPFVADDILQTADDARAEAAMGALLELSGRTQVILLTHHCHIVDLAERAFPGAVCLSNLS
jgi:uncharacterized protein YhaN